MGCKSSKASPPSNPNSVLTPVVLNVYDLTPLNNYTYWFGFGIFHSGIEVYGMEYGFGAHDYPTSGVFEVEPKSCPGFSYRCSLTLGYTNMLPFEFREFIDNIAAEYHGDDYHLISKNCNHFSNDVCLRLTGKPIPRWVNRLAHLSSMCCCLLPKSLKIEAVKGEHQYRGLSVAGAWFSSSEKKMGNWPHSTFNEKQEDHIPLVPISIMSLYCPFWSVFLAALV